MVVDAIPGLPGQAKIEGGTKGLRGELVESVACCVKEIRTIVRIVENPLRLKSRNQLAKSPVPDLAIGTERPDLLKGRLHRPVSIIVRRGRDIREIGNRLPIALCVALLAGL